MIICFECTGETKDLLDRLVTSGQYRGYSEVIAIALANQVLLHRESKTQGATFVDAVTSTATKTAHKGKATQTLVGSADQVATKNVRKSFATIIEDYGIPDIFLKAPLLVKGPVAPPPTDDLPPEYPFPLSRWIFGQYSKLLPVKAGCRAIANLVGNTDGIVLDSASSTIAQKANELGLHLTMLDRRFGRVRDESLSHGFPTKRDADKGRMRFANQFVASTSKDGKLRGLLADLKLINWLSAKDKTISLTKDGWQFALIVNPTLDSINDEVISERFSADERNVLLQHIGENVPNEGFAYLTLLSEIAKGKDTPEHLRKALSFLEEKDTKFSASFFATQRSGALSRMADLSLIQRHWKGIYVNYEITNAGGAFLKEYSK